MKALWLGSCMALAVVYSSPLFAKNFQRACATLPFPVATEARDIDRLCPAEGGSSSDSPKGLQNKAKNNLCASNDPKTLTFADFMSLQHDATARHILFGADGFGADRVEHLPTDRTSLTSGNFQVSGETVNEGDVVQIVAFMDDPHPADLGSGENVNCNQPDASENDIHINLVERPAPPKPKPNDPDADEKKAARKRALCKAIVAEVIPHFRPENYDAKFLFAVARRRFPVKIVGKLFFDATHRPCDGDTPRDSSVRGTLWEFHPIYSIDVCRHKSLGQCPADDSSVWRTLDQFIQEANISDAELAEAAAEFEMDEERRGEHEGE